MKKQNKTVSSNAFTPQLRKHASFSAFVVHFSSYLCIHIYKVAGGWGWGPEGITALPSLGSEVLLGEDTNSMK